MSLVTGLPIIDEIVSKLGTKPDDRMGVRTGLSKLDAMTRVVPFAELLPLSQAILKGQIRGRTVVDVNG